MSPQQFEQARSNVSHIIFGLSTEGLPVHLKTLWLVADSVNSLQMVPGSHSTSCEHIIYNIKVQTGLIPCSDHLDKTSVFIVLEKMVAKR